MRHQSARHIPIPLLGRIALTLLIAMALLVAPSGSLASHEIPSTVTVFAFVKPDVHVLHVVLRVPLEAMRDVDFPLRAGGMLDVARAQSHLQTAATTWIADYLALYENGAELKTPRLTAVRASLPSDRSFTSYDVAVAHLAAPPLDAAVDLPWRQAMLDVEFEYTIQSQTSAFEIKPELAHLGLHTTTVLRFIPASGAERAFTYIGNPGRVALDPRWHQAALRFVELGFTHILGGIDHLLFVLCLVIPVRRVRPLIVVITSFTVAHSITLAASALGFAPDALWFPPLIEVLVAVSIVYMALENIVGGRVERRWLIAFGFGLVHGFAFSFALRESMQFGGSHLAASLVAFNVGVEGGQLFVLALAVPALALLFSKVVQERMGTIILSALIAHTAWHWMLDRGATLGGYHFQVPAFNAALAVGAMRATMVLIVAALAVWLLSAIGSRLAPVSPKREVGVE
ncbi:MAG: HupE/UreJ family protein [bacterium]